MTSRCETLRRFLPSLMSDPQEPLPADGDSLLERGILDSVTLLRLIAFLEEEFAIAVDEEDILPANFVTLDAIAGFVEAKL